MLLKLKLPYKFGPIRAALLTVLLISSLLGCTWVDRTVNFLKFDSDATEQTETSKSKPEAEANAANQKSGHNETKANDKDNDKKTELMPYQRAQALDPIAIPDDVKMPALQELLTIPEIQNETGFVPLNSGDIPRPPTLVILNPESSLQIVRGLTNDEILVDLPADILWEQLQAYWQQFNLAPTLDVSRKQLISPWLEYLPWNKKPGIFKRSWSNSIGFISRKKKYHRYRISLLAQPEVLVTRYAPVSKVRSKILVGHIQVRLRKKALSNNILKAAEYRWDQSGRENKFQRALVTELIQYLKKVNAEQKSPIMPISAMDIRQTRTVMTKDGNGFPVLVVEKSFPWVWLQVGHALGRAQVTIEDKNRSLGVYYVLYQPTLKQPTLKEGTTRQLQVKLSRAEKGTYVSVQIDGDTLAPVAVGKELLEKIERFFTEPKDSNPRKLKQPSRK